MKVDICMWAKNGESYLPRVLRRIAQVIPKDSINRKIFVDDSSTDRSPIIAEALGWEVYENKEGWINGGAKEALKHIETEFFISVEQDVFLCRDFWNIRKHMFAADVAVACGIYLPTEPLYRAYYYHLLEEMRRRNVVRGFGVGSNIYRTEVIREVGFIKDPVAMSSFYENILASGYKWIVDYNLVSDHIRKSFWEQIKHDKRFYMNTKEHVALDDSSLPKRILSVLKAIRFLKTGNPTVALVDAISRINLIGVYIKRKRLRVK